MAAQGHPGPCGESAEGELGGEGADHRRDRRDFTGQLQPSR